MAYRELPPPPTPDEYFDAALKLDADFDMAGGAGEYLMAYSDAEAGSKTMKIFQKRMTQYGLIIEPMDRSTLKLFDETYADTQTIVQGGIAGELLISHLYQGAIPARMVLDSIGIGNPQSNDEEEGKDELARKLMERGWNGLDLIGESAKLIVERWEDEVAGHKDAHMFRVGLGIVAMCADRLYQDIVPLVAAAEARQFSELVVTYRDPTYWNVELERLLSEDNPSNDPSQ